MKVSLHRLQFAFCVHSIYFSCSIILSLKVAVILLALVLGEVATTPFLFQKPKTIRQNAKLDMCKLCIEFSGQFINQLLNIILSKFIDLVSINSLHCSEFSCEV